MVKTKLKSIVAGLLAAILVAAGPAVAAAKTDNGNSNAHNKITICHATGSQTNPYVVITPDANGVISGHVNHQDSGDIIPPFDYNDHGTTKHFAGQGDQSILANGCVVASNEGGGQGGGGNNVQNNQNSQVLGAVTGGQGGVTQTPVGGVNAGAGGGSALSFSSL